MLQESSSKRAVRLVFAGISAIRRGNIGLILNHISFRMLTTIHNIDLRDVEAENLGLTRERSMNAENSGGPTLKSILNALKITPDDAIIDLGSGKGGVLITLAEYPFKKIAGLDISPVVLKVAQDNLAKLGIANVTLHCGDAGDFSNLDEFNYIYMFNPFPCKVMEEVMVNVSKSLIRSPRDMTILYKNPICHETIIKDSLFKYMIAFDRRGNKYQNQTEGVLMDLEARDFEGSTFMYKHNED